MAGKAYTFNIKVQKDRLEVQTIAGKWEESKINSESKADKYYINLPDSIGDLGDLEFSPNVKVGTAVTRAGNSRCLEVLGNSFTISYKVTVDNCHLGPVFANKETLNEVKRTYYEKKQNSENTTDNPSGASSDGYYEFTYTIASPIGDTVYLKKGEYLEVGDILFQDGKWGDIPNKIYERKKTPVGIVFRVGAGGYDEDQIPDDKANYKDCKGWNDREIRGYAVALEDATDNYTVWSDKTTTGIFSSDERNSIHKYYSGLYITNRLKAIIPTKKLTISNFPAFQKAEDYKKELGAPVGTSGWYLPSYIQLNDIYNLFKHPLRREWITNAGGNFFNQTYAYCSAAERSPSGVWMVALIYDGKVPSTYLKGYKYFVRSVLTF